MIDTLRILPKSMEDSLEPVLGVEEGGIHAAEALLLARYFMYTQVYFHHVRRIYGIDVLTRLRGKVERLHENGLCFVLFVRGIVDAAALKETGKDLIATAFYAHSTDLLRRAAHVLGKPEDEKFYGELFEKIKSAFC